MFREIDQVDPRPSSKWLNESSQGKCASATEPPRTWLGLVLLIMSDVSFTAQVCSTLTQTTAELQMGYPEKVPFVFLEQGFST